MHRILIFVLSLAALVIPTTSWAASTSANLAVNVTPGQAITAINLSNNNFTGGAPSGTVVGAISVTMSPVSPAFSGSLSLSGANASQFQIVGSNLVTSGTVPAGNYNVNIVATQAGAAGSPFTQAETVTGTSSPPTGVQKPGPSLSLFNSPYYTCVRNFYVDGLNGNDSNNGTSTTSAWKTIANADTSARTGGDCINVMPTTTYTVANGNLTHGGNAVGPTGYVVYRCTQMDACQIVQCGRAFYIHATTTSFNPASNFFFIDGFTFSCSSPSPFSEALIIYSDYEDSSPYPPSAHHVWFTNNIVSGMGESGVQLNDGEYFYTIHNKFFSNAAGQCGPYGSGISYAGEADNFSPALPTTNEDQGVPGTRMNAILGDLRTGTSLSALPANDWFHNVVAWNVLYNNHIQSCSTSQTDGNGIIMDTFSHEGNSGVPYPHPTLVAFNITYNNGGGGIISQDSTYIVMANNSGFNSFLDQYWCGTARGSIEISGYYGNYMLNNISVGLTNTGGNGPFPCGSDQTANNLSMAIWANTVSDPTNGRAPGGNVLNDAGGYNVNNVISCAVNKCNQTRSAMYTNAGNASIGSETTQSAGTNFALQAGNPAIGFGLTESWLPSQSVDSGACHHTLASCP
jgi:hypothetical protein